MPLRYKVPAYVGNALLLLLGFVMVASGNADNLLTGAVLGALAALNLFLVYKLDRFSREEVWLAHELEMTKMREELLATRKRLGELEAGSSAPQQTS
jgi:hypothetical protein